MRIGYEGSCEVARVFVHAAWRWRTNQIGVSMSLEQNKSVVVDYYQTAFNGNPEKAVADHFGDRYIQHNPQAPDGPEAFIGFVHWLRGQYPQVHLDIKRVIAEGDMVVTHSHLILTPATGAKRWRTSSAWKMAKWSSTGTSSRTSRRPRPTPIACSNKTAVLPPSEGTGQHGCTGERLPAYQPDLNPVGHRLLSPPTGSGTGTHSGGRAVPLRRRRGSAQSTTP
jgi:predicted SnoaL-like aldol condensation-catalyzing enzyme